MVEVEVGGLPVVEHHRPGAIAPRAADQPPPVQAVERLGQAAQPIAGPGEDRLRRRERRTGLQPPGERLRVDADPEPGRAQRVHLGLGQEVAAVHEAQAERLAGVLGGVLAAQREEWVVLETGRPPQAAHGLPACDERPVVDVPLPGPGAAQRHEPPVRVRQVEDRAHRAPDGERRAAAVGERERAGEHRAVREQRRPDRDQEPGRLVAQVDLERLGLGGILGVGRRQPRQLGLAGQDAVLRVAEVQHGRAVRPLDDQRGHPEVAHARHRHLERHRLADPVREPRELGRAEVPQRAARAQRRAGVEVAQPAILQHPHREADPAVGELPLARGGIPVDRHPGASSVVRVQVQR